MKMAYGEKGIIPPKQWHHDPLLKDNGGLTVALFLISNDISPPKEW